MEKLANGQITPKTDFTDQAQLLSHLKYRAKIYRTSFGFLEDEIDLNLRQENNLNAESIRIPSEVISGLVAGVGLLPRRNISVSGKKGASMTHTELRAKLVDKPKQVIEDFLPENSVSLLAGDSGIGKSPFLIQMGLSVAAGLPFLGNPVTKGGVLYVDYENGEYRMETFITAISKFLNLPYSTAPDNFKTLHGAGSPDEVIREIETTRPKLVMIDAVRGFDSNLEDKNTKSGERLTELLNFAEHADTSILLLHHLRKTNTENPTGPLERTPVMEWLQQVSGPRALVNQTATRIGMEKYDGAKQAELVLKGHFKGVGEFGPWYIGRIYDEMGEPLGYKRITGVQLLSPEHLAKFHLLPDSFHFTTAKEKYGRAAPAAVNWLRRLMEAGVIVKRGDGKAGHYTKT